FFSFTIADDGETAESGYLIVDGAIVSSDANYVGTGWSYTKSTRELKLTGNVYVQGFSTNGDFRLVVPSGGASSVTLKNLTLTAPATKYASAMIVSNDCTLALSGSNALAAAGQYAAGIEVVSNATLTVSGGGALSATGGKNGAGIGSRGGFAPPGKIVIESGDIMAQGGEKAAGIGGGSMSNLQAGNIAISGGTVTATGGANAPGIGQGYMGSVSGSKVLPENAVAISGGTVYATRGSVSSGNLSDLINGAGANSPTAHESAFVITGGSVNGTNLDFKPTPVDANDAQQRYLLLTGLSSGDTITLTEASSPKTFPATYGWNDVKADATGSICLWMPVTNAVRVLDINGLYYTLGGETNNVAAIGSGASDMPESVTVNGKTRWLVAIPGQTADATIALAGLEDEGLSSATAGSDGTATIYLRNGTYRFTVDGERWVAVVEDAPAIAYSLVADFKINGADISNLSGTGWTYDGEYAVTLSGAGPFVLSGRFPCGTVDIAADCEIVLSNALVSAQLTGAGLGALNLRPGVSVALALAGDNTLIGESGCAAIAVPSGATLAIDSAVAQNSSTLQPFNLSTLATTAGTGAAAI
ncbi:MAG: hypothetical protein IJP66_08745, partial [Kiritimatiellae bacterium]|nr:hypothetical protein [Kiritimatiellia bacterium]